MKRIKLPPLNAKEKKAIRSAGTNTPGIHYGDKWYPEGTRQYKILRDEKSKLRD